MLDPLLARALGLGRRLTGADAAERIRHKLDLAGNPPGWTVDRVVAGKVLGAVARPRGRLALAADARRRLAADPRARASSGVGRSASSAPNLYLYQKAYDRSEQLQRELPDAIDLLTISVESGLGFDAAVQQVARNTEGPLADEFSRVLREMQIGQGRSDALRALAERTNVPTSQPSSARWCRPTRSASRSPRCCACSPRRCGSSGASGPRRRPSRCRSRSRSR